MPDLDTAEYRKLALIAAGVPLDSIPPIIDTATWRKMMIAALLKNTANQAIAGRVDYYSQLPVTVGSPGIGTTYLVLNSSGIYYINYKSAGVYVKLTDTGSLSDWVYAPLSALGTLPDVTLTNQQVGETIIWNGTNWINSTPSGASNVQIYALSSDVSWSPSSFFTIVTFNLLAGKKYFFQMNSLCRQAGGSQAKFYLSASGGNPINYLSGVYTNYVASGPFPEPLFPFTVSDSFSVDQGFRFDCIIQQASNDTIIGSIANCTLKKGSQIVLTQID